LVTCRSIMRDIRGYTCLEHLRDEICKYNLSAKCGSKLCSLSLSFSADTAGSLEKGAGADE